MSGDNNLRTGGGTIAGDQRSEIAELSEDLRWDGVRTGSATPIARYRLTDISTGLVIVGRTVVGRRAIHEEKQRMLAVLRERRASHRPPISTDTAG